MRICKKENQQGGRNVDALKQILPLTHECSNQTKIMHGRVAGTKGKPTYVYPERKEEKKSGESDRDSRRRTWKSNHRRQSHVCSSRFGFHQSLPISSQIYQRMINNPYTQSKAVHCLSVQVLLSNCAHHCPSRGPRYHPW